MSEEQSLVAVIAHGLIDNLRIIHGCADGLSHLDEISPEARRELGRIIGEQTDHVVAMLHEFSADLPREVTDELNALRARRVVGAVEVEKQAS